MTEARPQVSWKAIEVDAVFVGRDGTDAGRVTRVVGDKNADVFTGLAVSLGLLKSQAMVASERVTGIWPDRVETDLGPAELESLPPFEEEPVVQWTPGRRSFLDRLFRR